MATMELLRTADAKVLDPQTSHKQQLLGVEEAACFLGLSVWTMRSWAYSGKITSHKLSTRLMFHIDDLQDIVDASRRPAKEVVA